MFEDKTERDLVLDAAQQCRNAMNALNACGVSPLRNGFYMNAGEQPGGYWPAGQRPNRQQTPSPQLARLARWPAWQAGSEVLPSNQRPNRTQPAPVRAGAPCYPSDKTRPALPGWADAGRASAGHQIPAARLPNGDPQLGNPATQPTQLTQLAATAHRAPGP
jgi:hypothetical protein